MNTPDVWRRLLTALVAGWAGLLLTLAFVAAPTAFAILSRESAGLVAARLFALEAQISVVVAAVVLILLRRRGGAAAFAPGAAAMWLMGLTLGALFCTVVGYFALQPVMLAARAGQTAWPFAVWHGVSMGFFAVKGLLVLLLAWRLTAE